MAADFAPDLRDPGLYVDHPPHEVFARLRREKPVYWNPEADGPLFLGAQERRPSDLQ